MVKVLRCSVRGCTTNNAESEMKLFHFPKYLDQCKDWVSFCDNSELEMKFVQGRRLHSLNYRICAIHFEDHCFRTHHRRKIFRGVLPTLHPPLPQDFLTIKTEADSCSSPNPPPEHSLASSPIPEQSPPSPSFSSLYPNTLFPSPSQTPPHLPLSEVGCNHILHCSPCTDSLIRYAKSQKRKVQKLMTSNRKLKGKFKVLRRLLNEGGEEIMTLIQGKLSHSTISINTHPTSAKEKGIVPEASAALDELMRLRQEAEEKVAALSVERAELQSQLEENEEKMAEVGIPQWKEAYEKMAAKINSARERELAAQESLQRVMLAEKEAMEEAVSRETEAVARKREAEQRVVVAEAEVDVLKTDMQLALTWIQDLMAAIKEELGNGSSEAEGERSESDSDTSEDVIAAILANHRKSSMGGIES